MRLCVAKIHRVHGETNVGGVFSRAGSFRNFDQLDRALVKSGFVFPKPAPVGIRFFDGDLPFFEHSIEDFLDIEFFSGASQSENDIFKVDEERELMSVVRHVVTLSGSGRR